MTRRMLINAQVPEELRVAVVSGSTLEEYQVEVAERGLTRGNIYRGTIASVQPSLNAAFIDFGAERHGFLPIQDVVPEAYYRQPDKGGRARIEEVLERGKPIVVQAVREPEGQKGAALTTNISIAGRYLVLTPFDSTRGISRKVEDEEVRKALRKHIDGLELPEGCGLIVRTNAIDQNKTALRRDLSALLRLWKTVGTAARQGKGTRLLYSDQNLILSALRDYLDSSMGEVLVDTDEAHAKAEEYMKAFMPRSKTQLVRYKERAPLFSRFDLEAQIEKIYQRRVELPGGGSIVIDPTEALTSIDVNSGKSTGASSQAETALHTNLEAAAEVARQLRLRDIGGLMVVDFIDMRNMRHRKKLEKELRDAMKPDKARHTIGRISSNGLLEINRQRIQQALHIRTHQTCPTCDGTGHVPSPEMVALGLMRRIEARAAGGRLAKARVALHPALADAVQNGRRRQLAELETEFDIRIEIVSDPLLHRPEQEIEWALRDPSHVRPRTPRVVEAKVDASSLVAPILDGDDDDGDSDDDATETRGRRRRGRRGGRKRRRPAEPDVTERDSASEDENGNGMKVVSKADAGAEESDGETKSPDSGDDEPKSAGPRKRRSRGGRGRGRRRPTREDGDGTEQGGDSTEQGGGGRELAASSRKESPPEKAKATKPAMTPSGDGAELPENEDGDIVLPRRPRRARRRRQSAGAEGEPDNGDSGDSAGSGDRPERLGRGGSRRAAGAVSADGDGHGNPPVDGGSPGPASDPVSPKDPVPPKEDGPAPFDTDPFITL